MPLQTDHSHAPSDIRARLSQDPKPGYLRDMIYGGIDGGVTTFAIVAGVAGAGLDPIIVIALGLANVVADGFSMAASNYVGTKAEEEDYHRLRQIEDRHIDQFPEGEKTELRTLLMQSGLSGDILEGAVDQISSNRSAWIDRMMIGEYGLSNTLPHALNSAFATFLAFIAVGIVPLVPFILKVPHAFEISGVLTLISFFAIGAVKSFWSLSNWWRSGLSTFAIGGGAAVLSYIVANWMGP